jgi:hypothetical protein
MAEDHETVQKRALKAVLRDDLTVLQRASFLAAVEARVKALSRRWHVGTLAFSLFIQQQFDGVYSVELPDFQLPEGLFTDTFIRQFLLYESTGSHKPTKPNPHVAAFYASQPALHQALRAGERLIGDKNICTFAAQKYATCLQNHLVVNWPRRLAKFLKVCGKHVWVDVCLHVCACLCAQCVYVCMCLCVYLFAHLSAHVFAHVCAGIVSCIVGMYGRCSKPESA